MLNLIPINFTVKFGRTSPTALAAPVEVGIMEISEFLALLRSYEECQSYFDPQ